MFDEVNKCRQISRNIPLGRCPVTVIAKTRHCIVSDKTVDRIIIYAVITNIGQRSQVSTRIQNLQMPLPK